MDEETPVGDSGDYSPSGKGWRKSSYSMSNSHCIEVGCLNVSFLTDRRWITVRDSKAAVAGTGPVLRFDSRAWTAFLTTLRIQPYKSLSTYAESSCASRGQELSALSCNIMQVAWNISSRMSLKFVSVFSLTNVILAMTLGKS
jgi:membrane protein required for beta-lactamase induction